MNTLLKSVTTSQGATLKVIQTGTYGMTVFQVVANGHILSTHLSYEMAMHKMMASLQVLNNTVYGG